MCHTGNYTHPRPALAVVLSLIDALEKMDHDATTISHIRQDRDVSSGSGSDSIESVWGREEGDFGWWRRTR